MGVYQVCQTFVRARRTPCGMAPVRLDLLSSWLRYASGLKAALEACSYEALCIRIGCISFISCVAVAAVLTCLLLSGHYSHVVIAELATTVASPLRIRIGYPSR